MNLQGYDVAIELSRSAINKVLEKLAATSLWPKPFSGSWSAVDDKSPLGTTVTYQFAVVRPFIAPSSFGDLTRETSVEAVVHVDASVGVDFSLEGVVVETVSQPIEADLRVRISLDLERDANYLYLKIAFEAVELRRLSFGSGVAPHIARLIQFVAESLIVAEINLKPWKVPILPSLKLELPFLGRVQSEGYKSHWYKNTAGDLAAGLGLVLDESSHPVPESSLINLHRADGGGDLVVAVDLRFLNMCLNRALSRGHMLPRYGANQKPDPAGGFRVQNAVIRVIENRLRIDIEVGHGTAPLLHFEVEFFLGVVNGRFEAYMTHLEASVPGLNDLANRIAINAVFLFLLWALSHLTGKDVQTNISDEIEKIFNDKRITDPFGQPIVIGGPSVTLRPSLFQCDAAVIAVSFQVETT